MRRSMICAMLVAILIISVAAVGLTGCGNESWGLGNYTFTHIHIGDANGYCATVEQWHDNETGIEVKTKEYGSLYCSEGSYILFEDDRCPYC